LLLLLQPAPQGARGHPLRDEPEVLSLANHPADLQHVRVVQPRQQTHLAHENGFQLTEAAATAVVVVVDGDDAESHFLPFFFLSLILFMLVFFFVIAFVIPFFVIQQQALLHQLLA